jgi:hypothetical protein
MDESYDGYSRSLHFFSVSPISHFVVLLLPLLTLHSRCSPDAEQPMLQPAPITYSTLHANQLPQVHDLLERSFWTGIDGKLPLESPERLANTGLV